MKGKKTIILLLCLITIVLVYSFQRTPYYLDVEIDNYSFSADYYQKLITDIKNQYDNDDVVGILQIENTEYQVPVLQTTDNSFYLNHTPDKKKNKQGAIFLDYRVDINSSKKLLIYGHNSSSIDMPFKILEEFYDKDYYDNHKFVNLTTSTGQKTYEIFSVYVETSDFSYTNIDFENDEEYLKHIQNLKNNSMYQTDVELSKDDEILILQTCSTHQEYRNYQKKYLLIVLRRI